MSIITDPLKRKKWNADEMTDQSGKIVIITGANSGLGLEATKQLSKKGAKVVMACRNIDKAKTALQEVISEVSNASVELMKLDLSSLTSIHEFTSEFDSKYEQLDVLMNNAGIMQPPYTITEDGLELQIGVNHFGHFALTGLLLNKLKATHGSRVVNQSSLVHRRGKINFEDINSEKKYSRTGAYSQSKLANLLFTYELNRLFQENSIDSISVGVHPGYTATNLQHNGPTHGGKSFWSRLYTVTNKIWAQGIDKGTLPMLYAAIEDDVNGGDYIGPKGMYESRGYPRRLKSSKRSYKIEDAKKLWKISEELTNVKYDFNKDS